MLWLQRKTTGESAGLGSVRKGLERRLLAGGRDSNPCYRQAGCGFPDFCDQKVTKRNTKFFCDLWIIAYDRQLVDSRSQRICGGGPFRCIWFDFRNVRRYLTPHEDTVSTKGQLILPAEIRQRDNIEPGQEFEVERIDRGEYRLLRREPPPNEGLVDWLLACPEKGYFVPIESNRPIRCDLSGRCERPHEATKPAPNSNVIEWLRHNERAIAVDPIILGEIRFGVHLLSAGKRRRRLEPGLMRASRESSAFHGMR